MVGDSLEAGRDHLGTLLGLDEHGGDTLCSHTSFLQPQPGVKGPCPCSDTHCGPCSDTHTDRASTQLQWQPTPQELFPHTALTGLWEQQRSSEVCRVQLPGENRHSVVFTAASSSVWLSTAPSQAGTLSPVDLPKQTSLFHGFEIIT